VHAERGMRLEPPGNKTSADSFNKFFLSKKKIRSRFRELTINKSYEKAARNWGGTPIWLLYFRRNHPGTPISFMKSH
jgi:hypothetical protein